MKTNVFPYPGSKTLLADWITQYFPAHETYVEPFGGSAAILVNKKPSPVEIFNDKDNDIIHFFQVLRDRVEELVAWLENTPFSRQLHMKYAYQFYEGYRPDDDIERAGRFFYIRNTQFAQKYTEESGFRLSSSRNQAATYHSKAEELIEFRDRLQGVQIECLDYRDLVDRTDAEDTLFYFDPPYVGVGDELYAHGSFDHESFVDCLEAIDGQWIVSYEELPERLQNGYYCVEKEQRRTIDAGQGDKDRSGVERLVMNFNPDEVPRYTNKQQPTLADSIS